MASTRDEDMMRMQRMLDPGSVAREEEMIGQAPIPSMVNNTSNMTDIEKVQMLMDMGLDQQTAIEAVAMEKDMPPVDPRQFSGQQPVPQQMPQSMPQQPQQMANPGMGSLSGVPAGMERPMTMPTPRPEDLMMRQMEDGRDRTYNPRDAINSYNAPNT